MAALPPDTAGPRSEFPLKLGRPAIQALTLLGITSYAQLTQWTVADLGKLHGVGPKTICLLTAELNARGISFVDGMSVQRK